MPPGMIPSIAAGSPPGATPTMPGGYLRGTWKQGLKSGLDLPTSNQIAHKRLLFPPKQGQTRFLYIEL